jgi:hypothetical protein
MNTMQRTQVQLTADQIESLRALASRENVSISEVVRRAVDALAQAGPAPSAAELRRRAIDLSGRYSSGSKDGARDHDDYLSEAYRS